MKHFLVLHLLDNLPGTAERGGGIPNLCVGLSKQKILYVCASRYYLRESPLQLYAHQNVYTVPPLTRGANS